LEISHIPEIKAGEIRCPRCYGIDVVPSRQRGVQDAVMRWMGREPRRCRFCEKRFFAQTADSRPPG
jgi:phage FluMu protein Com